MALIKQSDSRQVAQEAIVLDLGDLQRQGKEMRRRAETEAERILESARAERERLLASAYDEGFQKGEREGREAGREAGREEGRAAAHAEQKASLASLEERWTEALGAFEAGREDLVTHARADALDLALSIAKRIVKREVDGDREAARRQLEAALELVVRPTRLRVRIRPEDAESVREALPSLTARLTSSPHVDVAEDDSLGAGSCIVSTESGEIDASIETQIERVLDALAPPRARSDAA